MQEQEQDEKQHKHTHTHTYTKPKGSRKTFNTMQKCGRFLKYSASLECQIVVHGKIPIAAPLLRRFYLTQPSFA